MTIGIYKLNFNGTDKVYIGQSVQIEARFISHKSAMRLGKSSPKLQAAFDLFGYPELEILIETSVAELDSTEAEAIEIYDSVRAGFNTLSDASNPNLHGKENGNAKYSDDEYGLLLLLLTSSSPTYTKREISEMTGISIYVVRHIAALESHGWLADKYPIEYEMLKNIKVNKPYNYGKDYPLIVSPEGIEYKVEHVTNFAKEHGMLQPKLTELLKGTRNMHKGWTRKKVEA